LITAKFLSEVTLLDDQLKKLKELMREPSFYAKMTHLDDHLKKFLVLEVEDSLLAD
jgi:ethanolamine utilization cobalamin adenosyltransferase